MILPLEPESFFEKRLDEALEDKELRRSLDEIPSDKLQDPAAAVRADVLKARDGILKDTKAYRDARDKAYERYGQVVSAVRDETRLKRSVKPAATMATVVGILVVLALLLDAWFDTWFLWLGAFYGSIGLLLLPIRVIVQRSAARRRLRFDDRKRERDALEHRYATVVSNEVISAIRRAINAHLRSFDTAFAIIDKRGLRELADPEREVPTQASGHLRTLMSSLAGGSLGLSGPRGCGKTTLIHSFATGRSVLPNAERRGLVVSAPVRYDAREFVLHLYARVCEQILNPQGTPFDVPRREQLRAARRSALAKVLFLVAAFLGTLGLLMIYTGRTTPKGPTETGAVFVATAVVALYTALFLLPSWRRASSLAVFIRSVMTFGREADTAGAAEFKPERLAEERLEEIRFQQTLASGWSASLALPLGSTLGGESKLTLARTPWTLPEVVDEFRTYVGTLTKADSDEAESGEYLVIGIDELDKIDSAKDAQRFLNDIKGVFGVRGCYYLVSVSEDAMSGFERRGMPFRDVFDSSFDAIMRVPHLTLAESRDVLESRVTGLPVPYQCFCHVLAGGLPRELVRVARELVQAASTDKTMSGLCRAVVASELRAKVAASTVAARAAAGRHRDFVLAWVQRHDLEEPGEEAEALRERFAEGATWPGLVPAAGDGDADRRLMALALELMSYSYYAATVLEFFGDERALRRFLVSDADPNDLSARNELPAIAADALATLARARQQFAMSPALVTAEVTAFRAAAGLAPWTLPRGLSTAGVSDGRVVAGAASQA
jgi:hypothetical protein